MEKKMRDTSSTSSTQKPLSVVLDEIEERANKATEGPWEIRGFVGIHCWSGKPVALVSTGTIHGAFSTEEIIENREFIRHARTDVPRLVQALRRATESIELRIGISGYKFEVDALSDIAAILNGDAAAEEKNLEKQGAAR